METMTSLISERPGTKGMKLNKLLDLMAIFMEVPNNDEASSSVYLERFKLFIKKGIDYSDFSFYHSHISSVTLTKQKIATNQSGNTIWRLNFQTFDSLVAIP